MTNTYHLLLGNIPAMENFTDELGKRLESSLRHIYQKRLSYFFNYVFSLGSSKNHHNVPDFSCFFM